MHHTLRGRALKTSTAIGAGLITIGLLLSGAAAPAFADDSTTASEAADNTEAVDPGAAADGAESTDVTDAAEAADSAGSSDGSDAAGTGEANDTAEDGSTVDTADAAEGADTAASNGTGTSAQDLTATPRIVGGSTTTIKKAPWQVALVSSSSGSNYAGQFCGGSIVNDRWIATAAHCVTKSNGTSKTKVSVKSIKVLAGITELSSGTGGRRAISKIVVPSTWTPSTLRSDYALIKLSKPLTWSSKVKAINLPTKKPATGASATITGWGSMLATDDSYGTAKYPRKLRLARIKTVSTSTCASTLPNFNSSTMICAGYKEGTADARDACSGDSGGPLAIYKNSKWYLYGTTSAGYGCAYYEDINGIYTNVAHFHDWTKNRIATAKHRPAFSSVKKSGTRMKFTVTNYSGFYNYKITKAGGTGKVTVGSASGSKLPITVTGIKKSKSIKIKFVTKQFGYANSTKTITIKR